jgi:membrane protein YdbS with pleckstrin-like domain
MAQSNNGNGKIYVTHINIRQSIFFLVLKLIFLDVIAAFFALVYFSSVSSNFIPEVLDRLILSYNLPFFLGLVLIKISLGVYVVLAWINEYYEVWPDAIIHRRGFIIKNEEKHPLSHIKSIKVEQGIFGKNFGYGTITIYDWYLEKETSLYLIHNPIKYYNIIESLAPKTEEEKEVFQEKPEI